MNGDWDWDELICKRHKIDLECMAGRSAHPDNWYCPKCDAENTDQTRRCPSCGSMSCRGECSREDSQ